MEKSITWKNAQQVWILYKIHSIHRNKKILKYIEEYVENILTKKFATAKKI